MKNIQSDQRQKAAQQGEIEEIQQQDDNADLENQAEEDENADLDFGGLKAPGDLKKQLGCGG